MKKGGIFLDEYGDARSVWIFVGYLIFVIVILLTYSLAVGGGNSKELEARADYKAFCESIGGSFGETHCYKDGKVVMKDQTCKMEVNNE